ncbi:MAG: deoxyribodipyrimidine photo-lyase [Chloroflexota bacterium]|nr:MAG: deoxyribodipyrimidine photo-lyase [Chloroflexota bacterium]
MIQKERIRALNKKGANGGGYVLYWMQASQRTEYNHALEYAIATANTLSKPVIVYFGITDNFPEANERHYRFMLEGLKEVGDSLESKGISFVVRHESPEVGVLKLSEESAVLVVDRGYLDIQKKWRDYVARRCNRPVIQVESDAIVPVEEASPKEEYSAATFRPKLKRKLADYLVTITGQEPHLNSLKLDFESLDIKSTEAVVNHLNIDRSVKPVTAYRGGISQAKKQLEEFINSKLDKYPELRNDPNVDCLSHMSPYIHFGQISPLYIALTVLGTGNPAADKYLDELVIRRELSLNFVHYNQDYNKINGLPTWARKTLAERAKDTRTYLYNREELEAAKTNDPYWNAAQKEMVSTGKMHGYMRMYWGKKIIEWSRSPEEAFTTAIYLNNKYELDGRDPNGFAGVAWCFGKHDRPWAGRRVFGNIRYMSAEGLRRKFDVEAYARRMSS